MINRSISKLQIEEIIKSCLEKLRKLDRYLLDNDANERSITHKIAEYLQPFFIDFNVDCEYNRFEDLVKKLDLPRDGINWDDTEAKTVFPDIIVHKRGVQNFNLLVIEVKKSTNLDNGGFDRIKIQTFLKKPYNYIHGLFLKIDMEDENDDFEWFPQ